MATTMDYAALRMKMVDGQIRTTDVTNHPILNAFVAVRREDFVAERLKPTAYIDNDIEIAPGRYMMAPSPLAKMLQLLEIRPTDHVLDLGAGTGYATALLAHFAGSVVGLESNAGLAAQAKVNLDAIGLASATIVEGDLAAGCPGKAPYDVILVNGAVETIPDALFSQLKQGGRLVAVVGRGQSSGARLFVREGNSHSERFAFNASVRMLPGFEKVAEFLF
ncbi:MAG: protein-L-isoaspartate O-methyltransferase [Rhizobium sp.]|nr:protein-L-isoaspartate O-methyltransferase [Rhizobium sp.]